MYLSDVDTPQAIAYLRQIRYRQSHRGLPLFTRPELGKRAG